MKKIKIIIIIVILFGLTESSAQNIFELKLPGGCIEIREGKKIKKAKTIGYRYFYPTGELLAEASIVSDNLFLFKQYYKSGQLLSIGKTVSLFYGCEYKLMRREEWKTYYENGQLKQIAFIISPNSPEGEVKEYYENGVLKLVGKYKNDKQVGEWSYFDENGVLIKSKNLGEGKSVIKVVGYKLPENALFEDFFITK